MSKLPLVPLRNIVLFPQTIAAIFIGRTKSINAIEVSSNVMEQQGMVAFVTQKNNSDDNPLHDQLYSVGIIGRIVQKISLPSNNIKIIVKAEERVKINNIYQDYVQGIPDEHTEQDSYDIAEYEIIETINETDSKKVEEACRNLHGVFEKYVELNKRLGSEVSRASVVTEENLYTIGFTIASHISIDARLLQEVLEVDDYFQMVQKLTDVINLEILQIQTDNTINSNVQQSIMESQRKSYIQAKIDAMRKELGDDDKFDTNEFEQKISTLKLSDEALEKAKQELKKLKQLSAMSSEAAVIRSYLEVLLGMPWGSGTDIVDIDMKLASRALDADHYGLEKVKERILEHLAVVAHTKEASGTILCLVGPPGVGKTSFGESIANAVGRKFAKFALGGVRDEAEIRGHRRTYIGSMPGKIIQLIKKAKTDNVLMLLDEIDKMASDYRGDPTSAILEVLDQSQNSKFVDHYLEVEYDVSKVMFIATANSIAKIPRPLFDRFEIIEVPGYTENEKFKIANDYIIPKQLGKHMIKGMLKIDEESIYHIIRYYTRESGVRDLDRNIQTIIRKFIKTSLDENINVLTNNFAKTVNKTTDNIDNAAQELDINSKTIQVETPILLENVTLDKIEKYLKAPRYQIGKVDDKGTVGLTNGLAYTETGGDLLYIEAVTIPGKGEIKSTGKLGDVMKESVQAAYSYFLSIAEILKIVKEYGKYDIHLHAPEGAIPKDGPSAGIAIFTTITSLMCEIPVKSTVAMTGEITLRGRVLKIGGLREKLLAASRGGVKTVIIPEDNIPDLADIPESITSKLEIIGVKNAIDVLKIALDLDPYRDYADIDLNHIYQRKDSTNIETTVKKKTRKKDIPLPN